MHTLLPHAMLQKCLPVSVPCSKPAQVYNVVHCVCSHSAVIKTVVVLTFRHIAGGAILLVWMG